MSRNNAACGTSSGRSSLRQRVITGLMIFVVSVSLAYGAYSAHASYTKVTSVVATVCSKELVTAGSGQEYRVRTSAGTYVVNSAHASLAADIYDQLQPGGVYRIESYGWRRVFILHPSITGARLAPNGKPVGSCG